MLRYSDVAWMDDRTLPSVKVRHNIQGLSALFPPAYLLSFAMDDRDEPLHDGPDLSLLFRSRMMAALGLCFRTGELSEDDAAAIRREIETYKSLRDTLRTGAGSLSPRRRARRPPWDVFQTTPEGNRPVVVWADAVRPREQRDHRDAVGLRSRTMYKSAPSTPGCWASSPGPS